MLSDLRAVLSFLLCSLVLFFSHPSYAWYEYAVGIASNQIGDDYELGFEGPDLFDCSGLTQYAYRHVGVELPRAVNCETQKPGTCTIAQVDVGQIVVDGELQAGDLIFFDATKDQSGIATHVGIYEGNNFFIHANWYGYPVDSIDLNTGEDFWSGVIWSDRVVAIRRLPPPPGPSTQFTVDDIVEVTEDGVSIRDAVADWGLVKVDGENATTVSGTRGKILSLPLYYAGYWFWEVDFEEGADGWVAEDFLQLKEVGLWTFNNPTYLGEDTSGYENHGTAYNVTPEEGILDGAAQFTGNDTSLIEVPHADILNPSTELTVMAWSKIDSFLSPYSAIVYKPGEQPTSDHTDRIYTLWATSNYGFHFASTAKDASSQTICNSPGGLYSLNEFVHAAGVIDTSTHEMKIYVNGKLVQTCSYPGDEIRGGVYDLRIGAPYTTSSDQSGIYGILDDVRIYSGVITESEISALVLETQEPNASTFDYNTENWMASGDPTSPYPTYLPDGGNPGGAIEVYDDGGSVWYYVAPDKFLGDKSEYIDGTLKFDLWYSGSGTQVSYSDVVLEGADLILTIDAGENPVIETWKPYEVSLNENSGWVEVSSGTPATREQIIQVLENLERLRIRGEFLNGYPEAGRLDNVYLIPGL